MRENPPLGNDPLKDGDAMERAVGEHPIATGAGAAGGIAAGAALGSIGGPVGSLVGAAVGGVAGALVGGGLASLADPVEEDRYWQQAYLHRPYAGPSVRYDDYGPAYRYGVQAWARYNGRDWHDVEADLGSHWHHARDGSQLGWGEARHAARDAWDRLSTRAERAMPGDADGDGR